MRLRYWRSFILLDYGTTTFKLEITHPIWVNVWSKMWNNVSLQLLRERNVMFIAIFFPVEAFSINGLFDDCLRHHLDEQFSLRRRYLDETTGMVNFRSCHFPLKVQDIHQQVRGGRKCTVNIDDIYRYYISYITFIVYLYYIPSAMQFIHRAVFAWLKLDRWRHDMHIFPPYW